MLEQAGRVRLELRRHHVVAVRAQVLILDQVDRHRAELADLLCRVLARLVEGADHGLDALGAADLLVLNLELLHVRRRLLLHRRHVRRGVLLARVDLVAERLEDVLDELGGGDLLDELFAAVRIARLRDVRRRNLVPLRHLLLEAGDRRHRCNVIDDLLGGAVEDADLCEDGGGADVRQPRLDHLGPRLRVVQLLHRGAHVRD